MCWIGLDRSGRWLLSASYGESLVAVSPIGDDGVAGPARQTCGTAPNAHSIQTDPANRFAFAACLGGDVVSAFAFDAATGSARAAAGAGLAHPRRRRAAPLRLPSDGAVRLPPERARRHGRCARAPCRCRPLRPRPDDRLDAARRRRQALGGRHPLQPRRALSLHQRAPLEHPRGVRGRSRGRLADAASAASATATEPRGFAIDPSGRWLLAAGQASHRLRVHAIDAHSGALADHAEHEIGRNPELGRDRRPRLSAPALELQQPSAASG